jgi:hypothetical protein
MDPPIKPGDDEVEWWVKLVEVAPDPSGQHA